MNQLIKSFKYAFQGILSIFKLERNFKIHSIIAVLVVILGIILKISCLEWCIILLCFALVLSVEMINTVLEQTANLISPLKDDTIGRIKDIAAGAVLVCVIFSIIIGLIIFIPKVF